MGNQPYLVGIITQGLIWRYGILTCCSSHVYDHSGRKKNRGREKMDWQEDESASW